MTVGFLVGMRAYGYNLIVHTYDTVIFFASRAGGAYDGIRYMSILHEASRKHHGTLNRVGLSDRRTIVSDGQVQ